jgi:hypothetical protein
VIAGALTAVAVTKARVTPVGCAASAGSAGCAGSPAGTGSAVGAGSAAFVIEAEVVAGIWRIGAAPILAARSDPLSGYPSEPSAAALRAVDPRTMSDPMSEVASGSSAGVVGVAERALRDPRCEPSRGFDRGVPADDESAALEPGESVALEPAEPVVSAKAITGQANTAPTPRATASAPTRPMWRA